MFAADEPPPASRVTCRKRRAASMDAAPQLHPIGVDVGTQTAEPPPVPPDQVSGEQSERQLEPGGDSP